MFSDRNGFFHKKGVQQNDAEPLKCDLGLSQYMNDVLFAIQGDHTCTADTDVVLKAYFSAFYLSFAALSA